MSRKRLGTRRVFFGSGSSASPSSPILLPQVGWAANLGAVNINSLSNLTGLTSFAYNFFPVSRTAPLKYKTIDMNGTFAAVLPDPTVGYNMYIWANEVNIGPGQGVGSTVQGAPYPAGYDINGTAGSNDTLTWVGGNGGNGGSGGAGGNAAGSMGAAGSDGSLNGTNGQAGHAGIAGQAGLAGVGTYASQEAGSPWVTTVLGGASSDINFPTIPGVGAAGGSSGILDQAAGGGGGAGGAKCSIICRIFGGTGPGTVGIFSNGGNGGLYDEGAEIVTAQGGGGGTFEGFFISYDGSLVPFLDGGWDSDSNTQGLPGNFILYELDSTGTIILATHTDASDTWNNL